MKKNTSIIILIFLSFLSYSQITIKGKIPLERNFFSLKVSLFNKDSVLITGQNLPQWVAVNEDFEIIIDSPGEYILNIKGLYFNGEIDFYKDYKFISDTSLVILLEYPFHYNQPCRSIFYKKNKKFNIPVEKNDVQDYNRTLRVFKKLKREKADRNTFVVRLLEEGAFEYGGGVLYEILRSKESKIICNVISFNSNYFDFMNKKNLRSYKDENDIYNYHLSYTIVKKKSHLIEEEFMRDLLLLLNSFKNTEDYCLDMIMGDRHPAMDGHRYYFEINTDDFYSFTIFENPESVNKSHKQIKVFLEIKDLIKRNIKE